MAVLAMAWWACHHGMAIEEGVWLIVMGYLVIALMGAVRQEWDKPSKRERKVANRQHGCSCFYSRAGRRGRQFTTRNRKPNRVGSKHQSAGPELIIRKAQPQLHLSWEECPRFDMSREGWDTSLRPKQQARKLMGLHCSPTSFFRSRVLRRSKSMADCCFNASDEAASTIRYDSDSFQIAIDNCATSCFTNSMHDFVGKPFPSSTKVLGIGRATSTYVGTVRWLIVDDAGRRHELLLPGTRFQAGLPFRLLCPQHVAQIYNDPKTTCLTLMDKVVFVWGEGKWRRTLPLHKSSNVGLMWSAPSNHKFVAFASNYAEPHIIPNDEDEEGEATEQPIPQVRDDTVIASEPEDVDLPTTSEIQREQPVLIEFSDEDEREPEREPPDINSKQAAIRKCHCRLNHMPFARIQAMAKQGLLPKYLAKVEPPMCASCAFGKATRRPWRVKGKQGQTTGLVPIMGSGACVSVDQLESPTPGFIGQMKGILTTKRYRVATIFVDHHSQLTFAYLQFSTGAEETVQAKRAFEAYATLHGVSVRHYHADNGRFAENMWLDAVETHRPRQTISFCGVGAHHQNGVAEKKIRDLQENARTMMLHASLRWPMAHSVSLWPYSLRTAVDVMNATPRVDKTSISPIEKFSGVKIRPQLKNFHSFGCPVYVLSAPLQTQQAQSKWMSRARLGIYLGMSPRHAKSVALVLNPRTGLVSPQFHVKFDDDFDTVKGTSDETHGYWKKLAGFVAVRSGSRVETNNKFSTMVEQQQLSPRPSFSTSEGPAPQPEADLLLAPSEGAEFPDDPTMDEELATSGPEFFADNMDVGSQIETTIPATAEQQTLRRSSRQRRPTWRAIESAEQEDIALPAAFEVLATYSEPEIADEMTDPLAFLAKSDPDTLYYNQAMKAPDAKEFRLAMQGEVNDHCNNKHWVLCRRSQVPEGVKDLDSVWAMRQKRRIKTKEVYKWKARLKIHGGQQEYGINYWETFAPVVTWISIRLVLILSILFSWHTRQIDFILAYPQAPIETPLFMEVPKGVSISGLPLDSKAYVLELKMNLYGQKQAGRVWYQHLTSGLTKLGFTPSAIDECVFY